MRTLTWRGTRQPSSGASGRSRPGKSTTAYVDLASAYAWRGQSSDAAAAVAELLKLRPGLTAQKLTEESTLSSSHPAFRREFQRIIEGARKAGLPER